MDDDINNNYYYLELYYNTISTVIEVPKSYENLLQIISKYYSINYDELNKVDIIYTDSEKDMIQLSNESDYEMMLMYMVNEDVNNIQIFIVNNNNNTNNTKESDNNKIKPSYLYDNLPQPLPSMKPQQCCDPNMLKQNNVYNTIKKITEKEIPSLINKLYSEIQQDIKNKFKTNIIDSNNNNVYMS